jgi:DNA polymerase-3 subunit delta
MCPASRVPPLTLVVGDEAVLVERAIAEVVAAARAADPDTEVVDVEPDALADIDLASLLSPSLFGERRIIVFHALHDAGAEVGKRVLAALADVPQEISVVAVHAGGQKGKALLTSIAERNAVRVECPRIVKYRDRLDFVQNEVRRSGASITEPTARAILDAVGSDVRELAMACAQLTSDTGGRIDADAVARYYSTPAEVTGFAVADAAVDGDKAVALAQLRWALATGVAPVLVTSALAGGVRQIARVASAGRGVRTADLARDLGMPPWKVERVQRQARGWRPEGIAIALAAVADADAAVKGAGVDPAYALERAVLTIAAARAAT